MTYQKALEGINVLTRAGKERKDGGIGEALRRRRQLSAPENIPVQQPDRMMVKAPCLPIWNSALKCSIADFSNKAGKQIGETSDFRVWKMVGVWK